MQRCGGIRRAGAAALDLAFVAAGWLDGFWEKNLHPWDVGAGSLLIQEAGGAGQRLFGRAATTSPPARSSPERRACIASFWMCCARYPALAAPRHRQT